MTASLPPASPQGVKSQDSRSGMRLSLAVARLDTIIARLNHLPALANNPFSQSERDQRLFHEIPIDAITSNQEHFVN